MSCGACGPHTPELRGLRPRAPSDFLCGQKVTKKPHRGQVCPLCTPACFVCDRRGFPVSFDHACRRAVQCLPLTNRQALRPPPLAAVSSCRFILRKCFCASYADCLSRTPRNMYPFKRPAGGASLPTKPQIRYQNVIRNKHVPNQKTSA